MARNVRINLTVDERVDEVVGRYAELTGTTKSGAIAAWLVRVLPSMRQEVLAYERSESAYQRGEGSRPLGTAVGREDELDRQDQMRAITEKAAAKASASKAEDEDDGEGSGEPLTRQQRRALERQEQKAARRRPA